MVPIKGTAVKEAVEQVKAHAGTDAFEIPNAAVSRVAIPPRWERHDGVDNRVRLACLGTCS